MCARWCKGDSEDKGGGTGGGMITCAEWCMQDTDSNGKGGGEGRGRYTRVRQHEGDASGNHKGNHEGMHERRRKGTVRVG